MSSHKFSTSTNWDGTAEQYAARIEHLTSQAGDIVIDMSNDIQAFSISTSNVLDSGAGSGVLTSRLGERYPDMPVLATDLSKAMLDIIDKKGLPNIKTKVVDANDPSGGGIEAETFSHVLSTFMIQFTNDQSQTIEEMKRILRKDGVIGIGIWGMIDTAKPWFEACKKIRSDFVVHGDFCNEGAWRTTDELEKGLRDAGFEDVKAQSRKFELEFPNADEYLAHWWDMKNPGIERMLSQWDEYGKREDVRPTFDAMIRKSFDEGKKYYLETVLAVGKKP